MAEPQITGIANTLKDEYSSRVDKLKVETAAKIKLAKDSHLDTISSLYVTAKTAIYEAFAKGYKAVTSSVTERLEYYDEKSTINKDLAAKKHEVATDIVAKAGDTIKVIEDGHVKPLSAKIEDLTTQLDNAIKTRKELMGELDKLYTLTKLG